MAFDTTTDDVLRGVRLDGRTVLVTGASSGIGLETARALASAGATVIAGARSGDVPLDLASFESIRAFAAETLVRHPRIDVLVNNAGVMFTPFARTADGHEMQFGTNHLGPFLLTALLMPALLAAAPARVVNVASAGHHRSDVLWEDPNFERRPYDKFAAYGQSKTANILFTRELDRRFGPRGVHAYAVHPGVIATGLVRHMTDDDREVLRQRLADAPGGPIAQKSIEAGAATSVWAAVAPDLDGHGGAYLADCALSHDLAPWAGDPDAAERLWRMSEELVGEQFADPTVNWA
jgi:NAD(P)-dependent dehydrogenase (short-subunit alcohol dehydrogenase family)